MKIVHLREAKTHLSRLLAAVAVGQEVVIARAGRPVARLMPLAEEQQPRRLGLLAGRCEVPEDWDAPLPAGVLVRLRGRA